MYLLLYLISFFASSQWFVLIPIRLYLFEILMLFFIAGFFIRFFHTDIIVNSEIKNFLCLKWGWVLIVSFSLILMLLKPQNIDALELFGKGFLQILIHTLFITTFTLYVTSLNHDKLYLVLKCYLAGVVSSCIYGLVQVIIYITCNFYDIDNFFWELLPFSPGDARGMVDLAYGNFFRLKGWTHEPNILSSSIVTTLPLLVAMLIFNKKYKYIWQIALVFLTLVLTQSLSGMLGFSIAMLIIMAVNVSKIKFKTIFVALVPLIPLAIVLYIFQDEALVFAKVRLDPQGTSAHHASIMSDAINLIAENPQGFGNGSFTHVFEKTTGMIGMNPHSSWISILVEEGVLGFMYQIIFSIYVIMVCLRHKSLFSRIFLGTYIGICIGGIFYETLSLFYIQFYTALFFIITVTLKNKTPGSESCATI